MCIRDSSNEDEFDVAKSVYENSVPVDFRSDIINNNFVFIYEDVYKRQVYYEVVSYTNAYKNQLVIMYKQGMSKVFVF